MEEKKKLHIDNKKALKDTSEAKKLSEEDVEKVAGGCATPVEVEWINDPDWGG